MALALLAYGALAAVLASKFKKPSPLGTVIRDGLGKYHRESSHTDRDQAVIYIALSFRTIPTLQTPA